MMIEQLRYRPDAGSLLYHYCSADSLLAILRHRTVRLADVSSMNDFMELQWGLDLLGELIDETFEEKIHTCETTSAWLESFMEAVTLMACCFSTKVDQLSQWRAYADNGAGFCIGFDACAIAAMPGSLVKVCYGLMEQRKFMKAGLQACTEKSRGADGVIEPSDFKGDIMGLVLEVAGMKNPAFIEEHEVRLVNPVANFEKNGFQTPDYPDALKKKLPSVQFMMRGSVPTPYVDHTLRSAAIREIWIGPKASVTERKIKMLLGHLGFEATAVHKSSASYR